MADNRESKFRLSAYGAFVALTVNLPILLFGDDLGAALLSLALIAIATLILIIFAALRLRRQSLSAICMLTVFGVLTWLLFRTSDDARTTTRWLLESSSDKARVVSQSNPADGTLKHVEWDGWGFAGAGDTTVYLVYDPVNELAQPAANRSEGKFPGLPCPVVRVHKLENHWYTVVFYTDTDWNHCTADR